MPNKKLIAAVLHELVAPCPFDGWVDLTETLKARCARLGIPYDSGSITAAVTLVARSRQVFVDKRYQP